VAAISWRIWTHTSGVLASVGLIVAAIPAGSGIT
jgi:hypothetical protein